MYINKINFLSLGKKKKKAKGLFSQNLKIKFHFLSLAQMEWRPVDKGDHQLLFPC